MSASVPLPIAASARMDVARECGWELGTEQYDEFKAAIKALDEEWLRYHAKKSAKAK